MFVLCIIKPKVVDKSIVETYKNIMLKMYDLHKRVQHLELIEWKRTHSYWFHHLFNISTAYETIDKMFEIKNEASVDDFKLNERENITVGYINKGMIEPNNSVCIKSGLHDISYVYWSGYRSHPHETRTEEVFGCLEIKPINETNIIGYINYKHAYNTNDETWSIEQIKQIINDNKGLYFEDYVKLFRDRFYRINEDDERLYKLIHQEMKTYENEHKKVKLW